MKLKKHIVRIDSFNKLYLVDTTTWEETLSGPLFNSRGDFSKEARATFKKFDINPGINEDLFYEDTIEELRDDIKITEELENITPEEEARLIAIFKPAQDL